MNLLPKTVTPMQNNVPLNIVTNVTYLLLLSTPPSPVLGDGPSCRTRGLPESLSDQAANKGGT